MATAADTRCSLCGRPAALVDEHERCEQCVINLEHIAAQALADLESVVGEWLSRGLTAEQLREAVDLSIADAEGSLALVPFRRRRGRGDVERAVWFVEPTSAFLDADVGAGLGRILGLRTMSGLSREALAERLDVTVSDVALWEAGADVPDDAADRMAELFGVSVEFLKGEVS